MDTESERSPIWPLVDGAASLSFSMLVALLINSNQAFDGLWIIGFIREVTLREDGLMAATALMLFPSTLTLYLGLHVFFTAKEAVEKKARARGRKEGRQEGVEEGRTEGRQEGVEEGRKEGVERVLRLLDQHGIVVPPEVTRELGRETNGSGPRS